MILMESQRISFDRVAGIYEDTRGHPPEISRQIADSLIAFLPARAAILEVGVGTGRIARPLLDHDMEIFGVDISAGMMTRFLELLHSSAPSPHLCQADTCQLPFRDRAFQAVLSVHVFHLIKEWQQALAEMQRVLRPEGLLCTGYDWRDQGSPHSQINDQWRNIISKYVEHPGHPGPRDFNQVSEILIASGARSEEIEAAAWEYTFSPAHYIQQLANGTFSYSWRLDPQFMPACIADLRSWTTERFGSLDVEFILPKKFIWQIFRWNYLTEE
jgi:ubiquinone/menaquinone biosynthesis C-methylase UbiE